MDIFRDCKQTYTKRLLWRDLNSMARHDAVRENDGARLIMQWKFYMFNFFEKNYQIYLIFRERLFLNVTGATSERMIHHLIWERKVNVTGGKGRNIPKDLHC